MPDASALRDEALVAIVRTHDQERYAELVDRYHARVLRYAKYLLGDADKAADAVQEAFVKAFVNLQSFDTRRKFSSWLYRIVHNEAMNAVKRQRAHLSLEGHEWIQDTLPSDANVERDMGDKETTAVLRACVDALPLRYREPLVLFFFEELSYEDISDVLRLPIGTVGTRINRGKKLLHQLYQQKGGERT